MTSPILSYSPTNIVPGAIRRLISRLPIAWRLLTGHLTQDDAESLIILAEPIAGWHPIITLTVEDVLSRTLLRYKPHPRLPDLVRRACRRASTKWIDSNDTLNEATEWCLDLIAEYADDEQITLAPAD